jgi:hypothetical protein
MRMLVFSQDSGLGVSDKVAKVPRRASTVLDKCLQCSSADCFFQYRPWRPGAATIRSFIRSNVPEAVNIDQRQEAENARRNDMVVVMTAVICRGASSRLNLVDSLRGINLLAGA